MQPHQLLSCVLTRSCMPCSQKEMAAGLIPWQWVEPADMPEMAGVD